MLAAITLVLLTHTTFLDTAAEVDAAAGRERIVLVELPAQPVVEEETTVVASTRTGRRLEDEPARVEVLGREEIEEKMLATLRHGPFALTSTYTCVRTREESDGQLLEAALTPAHSAGLVGMWEPEGVGRVGIEVYYGRWTVDGWAPLDGRVFNGGLRLEF